MLMSAHWKSSMFSYVFIGRVRKFTSQLFLAAQYVFDERYRKAIVENGQMILRDPMMEKFW